MKSRLLPILLCFASTLAGQSLTGRWEGELRIADSETRYRYEVELEQQGEAIQGLSRITTATGSASASFSLSGRWDGKALQLQEVKQLEPEKPKWCVKFLELSLATENNELFLQGNWRATGCGEGPARLRATTLARAVTVETPFSYPGRWTGYLSQTDREYGFYFELNLHNDGTGRSRIISEGAGGEAEMNLRWEATDNGLILREEAVATRTDPDWRWCIKQSQAMLKRRDGQYELAGDWQGLIEGYSDSRGACAPGQLFLSKPVVTKEIAARFQPRVDSYAAETGRQVRVDRTLVVHNNDIRLKVWDNGIVDGDVVTLFLNGERILREYRVDKRKWSIPVKVNKGENLLILHAEDLGKISPNTVAVSIDDGVSEQIIVLSSNLSESGAILIQPFVRE